MSMTEWHPAELGSSVHTQKGYAFKSGWYCTEGRRVVKVSNFTDDSVDCSDLICIPESIATDYLKYALSAGDVVLQTVGSWPNNPASVVGKCVSIPSNGAGSLLNQNAVKLSPTAGLDRNFLFYLLRGEDFKTYIIGTAQGAASQAAITLDAIRSYQFSRPPLPVQQRIAGILSVYDELIENSQRRIKILEAMSRGLYREWFVHFRFPGHEYHPRVASALGEIPQGWAVKKVGDLVEIKKGKKPTVVFESAESGLKRHLLIDALRGGSSLEFVMPDKLISTTVDDTIMVMDGSGSGDVFIGYEGVIGSTLGRYRVVDVSDGGPFWLFLFLDTHLEEIKSKNIGSAIPHANKDFINGMSVAVAPKSVLLNFEKAVTPMFGLIRSLRSKTGALRRTRDLLLPRLLSGQIDIGEI